MDDKHFAELVESVKEGGEILREIKFHDLKSCQDYIDTLDEHLEGVEHDKEVIGDALGEAIPLVIHKYWNQDE